MDKFDRIFQLHNVLSGRRTAIDGELLMARLECSKATLHRTINALRDALGAPIIFDADAGGYRYDAQAPGTSYELPGLWFSDKELQAMALMRRLLQDAGGGLLEEHLGTLNRRLDELMKHQRLKLGEAATRLRFPALAARPAGKHFGAVCATTLQRHKLWIEYHARSTDERTERTLSPQRVVHYRETWYLDAWDDSRDGLRSFSIDRILHATPLEDKALDVPEATLDEHYTTAYGIFGGKADKVAVLVFTPMRARWVADESWHPQQVSRWLDDGSYELRVPYRESKELLMDILRHGAEVRVMGPEELVVAVKAVARLIIEQYRGTS
jgi:predicted DNA-binding transcriptional regulator YafY